MRFSELRLIRYGRFADCTLAFPKGDCDLQIIVGPNEAGKSTTLSAVTDLLFGFEHAISYDFRFAANFLRVGAIIEGGDASLVVRRKRGRSGTLLDEDERPLDEARLGELLGGQSRESFQRMFSLDHARLRHGGRAILEAQDDVGQAIFAAGSGLVGIATLCATLDAEAKAIWTKRKSAERSFYQAEADVVAATQALKEAQVRPERWQGARDALNRAASTLADVQSAARDVAVHLAAAERQRRLLPSFAQLADLQAQLQALGEVKLLPANAAETLTSAEALARAAELEMRQARASIADAEAVMAAQPVEEPVLAAREAIEALLAESGAAVRSKEQLPRRKAEAEQTQARLLRAAGEIGWTSASWSELASRLPGRPQIAAVREVLERASGVESARTGAARRQAEAAEALREAQAELAALPPPEDIEPLKVALAQATEGGDLQAAMETAAASRETSKARLQAAMASLRPWSGDAGALESLVLPADAETRRLEEMLVVAEREQAHAEQGLIGLRQNHERLDLQQQRLISQAPAMAPDAIAQARADRDGLWHQLLPVLRGEAELPRPPAIEAYEEAVGRADTLADDRFDDAAAFGQALAIRAQLDDLELEIRLAGERLERARGAVAKAEAAWAEAVACVGPLSPAAYAAWLQRREAALAAAHDLETQAAAAERLEARCAATGQALGNALSLATGAASLAALVAAARQRVDVEIERRARRSALATAADAAAGAAERAEAQLSRAEEAKAAWTADWAAALERVGLSPDLTLSEARASIDVLEGLRSEGEALTTLLRRIEGMEAEITGFDARVADLANACGVPVGSAEARLAALRERLAAALSAEGVRTTQRRQKEQAGIRLQEAQQQADAAAVSLEQLRTLAGLPDQALLAAAVQRSEDHRQLSDEIHQLRSAIVADGDGLTFEALLAECSEKSVEDVQQSTAWLRSEQQRLSADIAELAEQRAKARAEFGTLDVGGADAAAAAADLAQALAELEAQAEAYLRKRAEAQLLRFAIDRYRAERQAPLLKRASVLFSSLTLGRYAGLEVDMDVAKPRLLGVLSEGDQALPPEAMSDGTVDQLFLALRIAAVEDAISEGLALPFLADDLFINFDDARAAAGFKVLGELASKTQVLFFTHHQHLLSVAEQAISPMKVVSCGLT